MGMLAERERKACSSLLMLFIEIKIRRKLKNIVLSLSRPICWKTWSARAGDISRPGTGL
jgi:hypothetical protein